MNRARIVRKLYERIKNEYILNVRKRKERIFKNIKEKIVKRLTITQLLVINTILYTTEFNVGDKLVRENY